MYCSICQLNFKDDQYLFCPYCGQELDLLDPMTACVDDHVMSIGE